ncbi:MAG TPA: cytochrome c oxidase subunit 3 [Gemmatimonadaceae bacterium]|nr:cytochrome c oxidase subunit 3 [Gemmatimonadaceae bacterium]
MATLARPYELPLNPAARDNPGWWVMVLIIATEAMLFVYLLFSYYYLASMARTPWPPGGPPELGLIIPNTILLLASSGTMWWGESGIRRGAQTRLRLGLLITLVLGIVFLVIQGIEYGRTTLTPHSNAYGSLFFTITGLHGAHVLIGLLLNVVVQVRAWLGHFSAERHLAVTNAAMYWHFVDLVWVAVFFSLYVTPYLR